MRIVACFRINYTSWHIPTFFPTRGKASSGFFQCSALLSETVILFSSNGPLSTCYAGPSFPSSGGIRSPEPSRAAAAGCQSCMRCTTTAPRPKLCRQLPVRLCVRNWRPAAILMFGNSTRLEGDLGFYQPDGGVQLVLLHSRPPIHKIPNKLATAPR